MSDLISRQAAIDAFLTELTKRERKNLLHTWSTVEVKYFVVDMLEKLPSAQPEERKESLCKKVRALCEESKIEFFFVGGGESTWSVTNDKHIKKIVECHKAQLSQEDTTKDATSDTISRQAAIEALTALEEPAPTARHLSAIYDCEDAIKALPSAQPEIIRCKDCKHWDGVDTCDVIDAPVWDNDFCSMAERRSNE